MSSWNGQATTLTTAKLQLWQKSVVFDWSQIRLSEIGLDSSLVTERSWTWAKSKKVVAVVVVVVVVDVAESCHRLVALDVEHIAGQRERATASRTGGGTAHEMTVYRLLISVA